MRWRLLVAGLWLAGLFAAVCHHYPVFRLKQVSVRGQRGVSSASILALADAALGDNLLRIDLGGWAQRIAALPGIARARAFVTLDGELVAVVTEAAPICLLDTRPVAGIAADGTILPLWAHPAQSDLPLITGVGGEPAYYSRGRSPLLLTALEFFARWQSMMDEPERLAEIHVSPDREVGIYLWPHRRFVTIGRGDWSARLGSLWLLIRRLPPASTPLDVRFANQVVETR